eukprot:8612230-Lingulodinium_polyedra.AAC.1
MDVRSNVVVRRWHGEDAHPRVVAVVGIFMTEDSIDSMQAEIHGFWVTLRLIAMLTSGGQIGARGVAHACGLQRGGTFHWLG